MPKLLSTDEVPTTETKLPPKDNLTHHQSLDNREIVALQLVQCRSGFVDINVTLVAVVDS